MRSIALASLNGSYSTHYDTSSNSTCLLQTLQPHPPRYAHPFGKISSKVRPTFLLFFSPPPNFPPTLVYLLPTLPNTPTLPLPKTLQSSPLEPQVQKFYFRTPPSPPLCFHLFYPNHHLLTPLSPLADHCHHTRLPPPTYNIVSDRRGGRTAWSSTVTISGNHIISARFWYDGQYVNNAKEDAAEVALQTLTSGGAGGGMGGAMQGAWRGREGLRGL